jgi:outer membrane protein OmpA-like peptidoglycan-associated protein
LALATGFWCVPAAAQEDLGGAVEADLSVQNFEPATSPYGIFNVDASQTAGELQVSGGLILHYDKAPLVFAPDDGGPEVPIVEHQVIAQALFSIGVTESLELGLAFPVYLVNQANVLADSIDGATIGDLRLRPKFAVLSAESDPVGLAFVLHLTLPTGDSAAFASSGQVTVRPGVVLDAQVGRLLLAANLGADIQSQRGFGDLSVGSELIMGAGAQYEVLENRFLLGAEVYGSTSFDDFFRRSETPLEGLLGFKYRSDFGLNLVTGVGRGLIPGYGAPDVRVFVGLRYAEYNPDWDEDGILNAADMCPKIAEDIDQFEDEDGCPDPDNDGDEILDINDKCPNEPEDVDEWDDEDGCPDVDNDMDQTLDTEDGCPNVPGPRDNKGCPIPDMDNDGILDDDDRCPTEPEDKDGFQDEDGCPDRDNDKDAILDVDDRCPNEPETYNQFEDEDGCPDKGIVVLRDEIKILDTVYFKTNSARLAERSKPLLRDVATVLKNYQYIQFVEIQGHTDDLGDDAYNLTLSGERARSVYKFLTKECGIDSDRLRPRGYGETVPAVPPDGMTGDALEAARDKNRRVQFIILKQSQDSRGR